MVHVVVTLVADAQAAELVEPVERALDHRAIAAEPAAMRDVVSREMLQRLELRNLSVANFGESCSHWELHAFERRTGAIRKLR